MWKLWPSEYESSFREQHRERRGNRSSLPIIGDLVIVRDETKNRNQWKLAVVNGFNVGRDGVVRAAKLRTSEQYSIFILWS